MTKNELRKKYKEERKKLSKTDIENLSIQIANQILKLSIWEYNNYHIFLPIERQNEINTENIIHILLGKDKNVIISKSNFENCSMTHYLLTDNTKIELNKYGIPEPITGIMIDDKDIDVVFVPMLAFDKLGNRVGYGKGFYDKFLGNCKNDIVTIGLNFFEVEEEIIDLNINDKSLDIVITPRNIYMFNKNSTKF